LPANNQLLDSRRIKQAPLSFGHRLHQRWEFRRFFDRAQAFKLTECIVFRIPNDKGHFRLGITLKARGMSVDRNRVKRVIREAFRNFGPQLGSFDYNVVVPGSRSLRYPYDGRLAACLKQELIDAIKRAGQEQK
jgi:ribonuclease P protein component